MDQPLPILLGNYLVLQGAVNPERSHANSTLGDSDQVLWTGAEFQAMGLAQ